MKDKIQEISFYTFFSVKGDFVYTHLHLQDICLGKIIQQSFWSSSRAVFFFFVRLSEFFDPLLGRARFQGRC